MAKQRIVNTKFWSDSFIVELNPLDRYFFLYLLTNEHTEICGIYELPWRVMARESGLDDEMLKKMFKHFDGRVFYIDGWIYIKNFIKNQNVNPSIKIGIDRSRDKIPSEILAKIAQTDTDWGQTGYSLHQLKPKLKLKPKVLQADACEEGSNNNQDDWDSKKYIEEVLKDKQYHIQIIGTYWMYKKFSFPTKAAAEATLKRDLRPAMDLVGYPIDRIETVMKYLNKKADFKWTLESVFKYINEQ